MKDELIKFVLETGETVYSLNNKPLYTTGVVQDITERKQAEEEIQRLASVVKHSSDFIGIADTEGNALFVNDAGREMVGLKDETQFINSMVSEYFPDNEQERVANEIMPAIMDKDNGRWSGEINFQHFQNGNEIPVWFDFFRIDDPNTGQPINFGTVTQDLSRRKEAETALRESEEQFNLAVRGSSDGIWDWNIVTGDDYFSPRFRQLLGYEENDDFPPVLDSFISRLHPDDKERVAEAIQNHLEKHEPYIIELRLKRKDGNYNWFLSRGQAIWNEEGTPFRMAGSVSDISERKNTEIELNQYRNHLEELVSKKTNELHAAQDDLMRKERLATLGQLTATVSHELRNPLGAMRPSLYMLKKKCDKSDERTKIAIERIDRNIDRCDRIIDELLDFTRIVELHKESILIDEWFESVIDDQILPEGIQLEKNYSLKDIKLEIDAELLRRAVINVFENGCHAMMDDNQQLVNNKNAHLKIKTTSNKNRIEISITDTGSGISEGVLSKIFEPLFSTKGFGVGLGMPTVKQIMEQHGGGIDIESDEGEGTTITLWLPMKLAEDDEK